VKNDLPDVAGILGRALEGVVPEQRPLWVALAERMAAERYRTWATLLPARSADLLACAAREEEIARRVEALDPEALAIQRDIRAKHPELPDAYRSLFEGRSVEEQLTIQARGERLGAATWRALAQAATEPRTRDTFLSCAPLEEENAALLESLVREDGQG
jgi:hypothetical protein